VLFCINCDNLVLGIIVATDGDTDITLPTNKAKLYGNTWPKPSSTGDYLYKWEKVSGPQQGTIVGKDDQNVELQDVSICSTTLALKSHGVWCVQV